MAVTDAQRDTGLVLVALALVGGGMFFVLTPARHLVRSDRKTARWFYEREMRASGNEERANAAAGWFYRLFGWLLIVLGLAVLVAAAVASDSRP